MIREALNLIVFKGLFRVPHHCCVDCFEHFNTLKSDAFLDDNAGSSFYQLTINTDCIMATCFLQRVHKNIRKQKFQSSYANNKSF